jgi:hypothetical protein
VSSDGKYFDDFVSGGQHTEVASYDSETDEFTWVCDAGAPASCPASGYDLDSTGGATSNS